MPDPVEEPRRPGEPDGGAADVSCDVGCEMALGIILGASTARARAAAEVVCARWPATGLLTTASLAAARWGVDIVPAIDRLAAGESLHGAMSDYERRTAAAEAAEALEDALDRLAAAEDRDPGGGAAEVVDLDVHRPEASAVLAAVAGHRAWRLPATATTPAWARVGRLATRLGARVITESDPADPSPAAVDPPGADASYVGFSKVASG